MYGNFGLPLLIVLIYNAKEPRKIFVFENVSKINDIWLVHGTYLNIRKLINVRGNDKLQQTWLVR